MTFSVLNIHELIARCKVNDSIAQKELYNLYSAKMFGLCRRYIKNHSDAEEILSEGFLKVFTKLDQLKDTARFEGWMRTIMVRECLAFLRKKNKLQCEELPPYQDFVSDITDIEVVLNARDILSLLDKLPDVYRIVFNLYVIEGYNSREIAEMLDISINTSKDRLRNARIVLRNLFNTLL